MNNTQGNSSNPKEELHETGKDAELVRRVQQGDMNAFGELARLYQDRVFRLALKLLQDYEDALDVSQEAFLRVHRSIHRFGGRSSFYTWLYRIVVNLCHDARRKKARRKNDVSLDQLIEDSSDNERSPLEKIADENALSPGEVSQNQEMERMVRNAIETLPEKHRTTLLLRELEGLSYEEIAEATGVNIGTVMSRLHYARKRVQEILKPYVGDEFGES